MDEMTKAQKAFQEWYEADAMPLEHPNWFRKDADGDYEIDTVHWSWKGWQAALAAQPAAPVGENETVRRKAQNYANFWYEQAAKNADKREHYEVIASQFQRLASDCLTAPSPSPPQVREEIIEECAKIAEAQAQVFLSPKYASNQPFGSLCERFACEEVARAIRSLSAKPGEQKTTAELGYTQYTGYRP